MTLVNLIVPWQDMEYIDSKKDKSFIIIHKSNNQNQKRIFFIIETTDEEISFLKLKYGENVWKR